MPSSIASPSVERTPAWKKLGLKLKQSDASSPAVAPIIQPPAVGHRDGINEGPAGKRKLGAQSSSDDTRKTPPHSNKKPRIERRPAIVEKNHESNIHTPQVASKKKKSVSFGDTPSKANASSHPAAKSKPPRPPTLLKKSKGPLKKQTPPSTDTQPALEYLRHWHTSRDSWKFNKNLQSALIKAVFESGTGTGIPATDIEAFYEYIQPLKGFVRSRLRQEAMEVRTKDVADGPGAFPTGTADVDAKQMTYETILSAWLESQQLDRKRPFDETEFVTTSKDADAIIRRVVKRMRAESVLATLSDGYETDASSTSAKNIRGTSGPLAAGAAKAQVNGVTGKRRRKLRVSNMSDSSSSESDSDSGSDTSSSGSSSSSSDDSDEEDDGSEEGAANGDDNDETSSSSSSSSDEDSSDDSDVENDD